MTGGRSPNRLDLSRRSVLGGLALAGSGLAALSACTGEEQELSLAIWRDYLGETTLDDFRRATGITVAVTNFTENAELHRWLKADPTRFDVVVPSGDWVQRMVREDLLARLDPRQLPNLANLEPAFSDLSFDPRSAHSAPYTWLALGIGYRKSKVPAPPAGWQALLEQPRYRRRFALPADPVCLFAIASKALDLPGDALDPRQFARAEAWLAKAIPHARALHTDGGQDLLLRGEVDLVAGWNGDLAQVALEEPDIGFIAPREGPCCHAIACAFRAAPADPAAPTC